MSHTTRECWADSESHLTDCKNLEQNHQSIIRQEGRVRGPGAAQYRAGENKTLPYFTVWFPPDAGLSLPSCLWTPESLMGTHSFLNLLGSITMDLRQSQCLLSVIEWIRKFHSLDQCQRDVWVSESSLNTLKNTYTSHWLEKETATHSSVLAWKIPWTEEPGGLQSIGSQRIGHDLATKQQQKHIHIKLILDFTMSYIYIINSLVKILLQKVKPNSSSKYMKLKV